MTSKPYLFTLRTPSLDSPSRTSSRMSIDSVGRPRRQPSKLPKDLRDFVMGDGIDDSISSDIEIPSSDNSDQEQVLGYDPDDSEIPVTQLATMKGNLRL